MRCSEEDSIISCTQIIIEPSGSAGRRELGIGGRIGPDLREPFAGDPCEAGRDDQRADHRGRNRSLFGQNLQDRYGERHAGRILHHRARALHSSASGHVQTASLEDIGRGPLRAIEDGSATSDDQQSNFPNIRATSIDIPIQGRWASVGAEQNGDETMEAYMSRSCLLSMPASCVPFLHERLARTIRSPGSSAPGRRCDSHAWTLVCNLAHTFRIFILIIFDNVI